MNQLQACISYSYPQKKMVDAFFFVLFFLPVTMYRIGFSCHEQGTESLGDDKLLLWVKTQFSPSGL